MTKKQLQQKQKRRAQVDKIFKGTEVMVLLEDMRGDIDIIAESQDDTNRRIDALIKAQENFTKTQEGFTQKLEGLTKTQEGFTKTQEGFTQKLEGLTKTQEGFTKTQEGFTQKLEGLTKTQEGFSKTQESFSRIQKSFGGRLIHIESVVEHTQSDVEDIKTALQTKSGHKDCKKIEKRVAKLERLTI